MVMYCPVNAWPRMKMSCSHTATPANAPDSMVIGTFHTRYSTIRNASSANAPCISDVLNVSMPVHWLPIRLSITPPSSSAYVAAPGLRTMTAAKGPANSHKPL